MRNGGDMTQEGKLLIKYKEIKNFIENNHRNPSKHNPEERYKYLNWLKQQRKLFNSGALKKGRVERFKELMELCDKYKHVNQYT